MSETNEQGTENGGAASRGDEEPPSRMPNGEVRADDEQGRESDSKISMLLEGLARLEGGLKKLGETFEKRLSYDGAKESAFDRLYAELDAAKKQAASDELRPLFIDLVLLYDRIGATCHTLEQQDKWATAPALVSTLGDELLEILSRREVELIHPVSHGFDASIQRAIGTEPAESETESGQIARVVRRGFRHSDRLLRPEEVIVKKSVSKTQTPES